MPLPTPSAGLGTLLLACRIRGQTPRFLRLSSACTAAEPPRRCSARPPPCPPAACPASHPIKTVLVGPPPRAPMPCWAVPPAVVAQQLGRLATPAAAPVGYPGPPAGPPGWCRLAGWRCSTWQRARRASACTHPPASWQTRPSRPPSRPRRRWRHSSAQACCRHLARQRSCPRTAAQGRPPRPQQPGLERPQP